MTNLQHLAVETGRLALRKWGAPRAVAELVRVNQQIWEFWVDRPGPHGPGTTEASESAVAIERLLQTAFAELSPLPASTLASPHGTHVGDQARHGALIELALMEPDAFVAAYLPPELLREDDRRYFVCTQLRQGCAWSPRLREAFHRFADWTNNEVPRELLFRQFEATLLRHPVQASGRERLGTYARVFLNAIRHLGFLVPHRPRGTVRIVSQAIDPEVLIGTLFGVPTGIKGLDQLFGGSGPILPEVTIERPSEADCAQEVPIEQPSAADGAPANDDGPFLAGRVILVRGPFGTGKTLLGCHLAASVARKAGLASLVAVEQNKSEYDYMLQSMGLAPDCVGTAAADACCDSVDLIAMPKLSGGGRLSYERAERDNLQEGLITLKAFAEEMNDPEGMFDTEETSNPPRPRLLVLDSLSALVDRSASTPHGSEAAADQRIDERVTLYGKFRQIADMGINLVVLEEDRGEDFQARSEEENLADMVIRLSIRIEQGQLKRFVQIVKSRFQREEPGEHLFTIDSGTGINVLPSLPAVRHRVAQRPPRVDRGDQQEQPPLGIENLKDILGSQPKPGQILLLEGPGGTVKASMGRAFLNEAAAGQRARLCVGEPRQHAAHAADDGTIVRVLPQDFSSSVRAFQWLDAIFDEANQAGSAIRRLVIDDIAGFDVDSPADCSDITFAQVLVDYLANRDTITLLVARSVDHGEPDSVRRTLMNSVDYHLRAIETAHIGERQALLTVVRCPEMAHRVGWFRVSQKGGKLSVSRTPALVTVSGQEVLPVGVRFFAWLDDPHGNRMRRHMEQILNADFNPDLKPSMVHQSVVCRPGGLHMEAHSTRRDVRIVQLDELDLPRNESRGAALCSFPADRIRSENEGFIAELLEHKPIPDSGKKDGDQRLELKVVPLACNVGLLVCRDIRRFAGKLNRLRIERGAADSSRIWTSLADFATSHDSQGLKAGLDWAMIAELSDEFERCSKEQKLELNSKCHLGFAPEDINSVHLFQIGGYTRENQNILFLEILLWTTKLKERPDWLPVEQQPVKEDDRETWLTDFSFDDLKRWFTSANSRAAAWLLRRLCRPAHQGSMLKCESEEWAADPKAFQSSSKVLEDKTYAIVSRQWFTSLKPLAANLLKEVQKHMTVCMLPVAEEPGDCAIAGEMYLGVLADSALPDAGLHLIHTLTSAEAEADRLRKGIGLPARSAFYKSGDRELSITPHLRLGVSRKNLRKIITHGFRRSNLAGYPEAALSLAPALDRILNFEPEAEDPQKSEQLVHEFIAETMLELVEEIRFVAT